MSFENIIFERKGQIAYLTLNRPKKLNALNAELMAEFQEAMGVVEEDEEVRALILTGAGRAFSSGFDIQINGHAMDPSHGSVDAWRTRLQGLVKTFMTVWNCSKPVIAAVNGYALGGACELVQVCDIKLASDRAILGEPEIRAGFGPPLLITPYSVNLATAKEMLLTGDTVDAYEAARIGLVNRVVAHDNLMAECEKVAKKICLLPQLGVKLTKASVNRAMEEMGYLNAVRHNLELMTLFDTSTSPEQEEFNAISEEKGLRAALDWRDARFRDLD
ncbi:MAG: enoyl-CoA hydratase/isomerase family protein [SAR202 cluster bacterium]|nr:enoyl-CoA hydratase/isomerase family protein [SAR202 cluster bacterium]